MSNHIRVTLPRYALSGAAATIVNIGLFWLLITLGFWYIAASITAFMARSIVKYVLLRQWVFKEEGTVHQPILSYIGIESAGLILGTLCIALLVEMGNLPELQALIVTMVGLYGGMFLVSRSVFTEEKRGVE